MKLRNIVACALLMTFWGCQPAKTTTLPENLVGVWRTSFSPYADRYIELTPDRMILGIGEGESTSYPIKQIVKVREEQNVLYHIYYTNLEGQEYVFSFYYDPADGGVMTLRNQKQVKWTRQGA